MEVCQSSCSAEGVEFELMIRLLFELMVPILLLLESQSFALNRYIIPNEARSLTVRDTILGLGHGLMLIDEKE